MIGAIWFMAFANYLYIVIPTILGALVLEWMFGAEWIRATSAFIINFLTVIMPIGAMFLSISIMFKDSDEFEV